MRGTAWVLFKFFAQNKVDLCRILLLLHLFYPVIHGSSTAPPLVKRELRLAVAVSQSFPSSNICTICYESPPSIGSADSLNATGMFPLAIYRKKGAAGAGIVEKPSRENEFKAFVPIPCLSLSKYQSLPTPFNIIWRPRLIDLHKRANVLCFENRTSARSPSTSAARDVFHAT